MASQSTDAVTPLTDLRPLHARACQHFVDYLRQVQPGQWDGRTPCSEWDVRALVDHVVRWNTFVPDFISGRSIAEMEAPFERDVLEQDPLAAAEASVEQAIAAFDTPGALERIVHHPFGEVPGAQVVYWRLFDNAIHGWDLARALGLEAPIGSDIVDVLYATSLGQREQIRASGHFGSAEVPVPDNADAQTRLLGLLGRKA